VVIFSYLIETWARTFYNIYYSIYGFELMALSIINYVERADLHTVVNSFKIYFVAIWFFFLVFGYVSPTLFFKS